MNLCENLLQLVGLGKTIVVLLALLIAVVMLGMWARPNGRRFPSVLATVLAVVAISHAVKILLS